VLPVISSPFYSLQQNVQIGKLYNKSLAWQNIIFCSMVNLDMVSQLGKEKPKMSAGPLRPPKRLRFHDNNGLNSCIVAQIEYMFGPDGSMPDPRQIDEAIGRMPGQPTATALTHSYLLEHGYAIRDTSPFDNAKFAEMTPEQGRAYLRPFHDGVDDVDAYFERIFTLEYVAKLQGLTRRSVAEWRRLDYQWTEGVATVDDVVALVRDGFVVDTYTHTDQQVTGGALVCSYEDRGGPEWVFTVYGLDPGGLIGLYTPPQFAEVADLKEGIMAITR
jgi:hypothetical protein